MKPPSLLSFFDPAGFSGVLCAVFVCIYVPVVSLKLLRFARSRLLLSYGDLPTAPGLSLLCEHEVSTMHKPRGEVHREWFDAKGKTLIIRVAPWFRPVILTCDPAFASFLMRNTEKFEISARMGPRRGQSSIPNLLGEARRRVRRSFDSAFSISTMRKHFPVMLKMVALARDGFCEAIGAQQSKCCLVNIKEECTRIMVDILGNCVLGNASDSRQTGKASELEILLEDYYTLRLSNERDKDTKSNREKIKAMNDARARIVEYGREALEGKKAMLRDRVWAELDHDDIVTLMCRNNLVHEQKPSQSLSDEELGGQIYPIIVGSTDILTFALSYTLHCIASDSRVQLKLRNALSHLGLDASLDEINKIRYLDNVIQESLRIFQPYRNIERIATEDSVVPLMYAVKGKTGRMIESVNIRKGTEVWVSLQNLNENIELYGHDAEVYRPERFTDGSVADATSYLGFLWGQSSTFWGGGRSCPVHAYAIACVKAVVFVFIRSFEIMEPVGQTVAIGGGQWQILVNGAHATDIPMIFKWLQ